MAAIVEKSARARPRRPPADPAGIDSAPAFDSSPVDSAPPHHRPAPFFSMRRTTSLALALLAVIAAVAASGILAVVRRAPLQDQYIAWSACAMLVLAAFVVLLIGRSMTHRSLAIMEQQLRSLPRTGPPVVTDCAPPDDLKPAMDALLDYARHVHHRMEDLRLQKKELDLQMRVAENERQDAEAVIFSIADAVLVINTSGEIVLANAAAESLFGFQAHPWRNRPIERVIRDPCLVTLLKDAQTPGGHGCRRQVEYSAARGGRTQTFNIMLSALVDAGRRPRGLVAVFHDVTRDRQTAQMKNDFVSAVSHEMRTPLSSIKAYTEMLADGEAQDEQTRQQFCRIIESETDRLQRLINNVLNLSRIESGMIEVHPQWLHVHRAVRDVIAMVLPHAREKSISLETHLGEDLPAVWGDADMFHQALVNVLTNAVKYTPTGGRITVTAEAEAGRYVAVSVRDNGMGIKPEDLPRIFDRFYRCREGTSLAKGTGLGLSLVKQIVETIHRGEIAVASEPGVGTTVVLRFPLAGALKEESVR